MGPTQTPCNQEVHAQALQRGLQAHRIWRMRRSFRVAAVKPPVRQPSGSPNASPGFMLASIGMNCSAPIAICAAENAVGPVTSTASAHTHALSKPPAERAASAERVASCRGVVTRAMHGAAESRGPWAAEYG